MFKGDHPDLARVMGRALVMSRNMGHSRCGSEHLLLALITADDTLGGVLGRCGATESAVRQAVLMAGPTDAGAAADRDILAPLGIDLDGLLSNVGLAVFDRTPEPQPLLPFGTAAARGRCARANPPIGLDAQAVYQASLRLALARHDREHRLEHLALALVAMDPGARWVLSAAGVDAEALVAELAAVYPPPDRNLLLRAERRIGRRTRCHGLLRRYQGTTGRISASPKTLFELIDN